MLVDRYAKYLSGLVLVVRCGLLVGGALILNGDDMWHIELLAEAPRHQGNVWLLEVHFLDLQTQTLLWTGLQPWGAVGAVCG